MERWVRRWVEVKICTFFIGECTDTSTLELENMVLRRTARLPELRDVSSDLRGYNVSEGGLTLQTGIYIVNPQCPII